MTVVIVVVVVFVVDENAHAEQGDEGCSIRRNVWEIQYSPPVSNSGGASRRAKDHPPSRAHLQGYSGPKKSFRSEPPACGNLPRLESMEICVGSLHNWCVLTHL
jgi:hypothetical protein